MEKKKKKERKKRRRRRRRRKTENSSWIILRFWYLNIFAECRISSVSSYLSWVRYLPQRHTSWSPLLRIKSATDNLKVAMDDGWRPYFSAGGQPTTGGVNLWRSKWPQTKRGASLWRRNLPRTKGKTMPYVESGHGQRIGLRPSV